MEHLEQFIVVQHNGYKSFMEVNSKVILSRIDSIMLLPQNQDESKHYTFINVDREGGRYDEGVFDFQNRDDKMFKLDKIIPAYWKKKSFIQRYSYFLEPNMFDINDRIEIIHNSRETIVCQVDHSCV